jgi:CHRD domain
MRTSKLSLGIFALTLFSVTPFGAVAQTFGAAMTGSAEFPAGSGSPDGSGVAAITVKGTSVTFSILVKGISTPTLAHIHKAPAGASGSVVIDFHAPTFTNGFATGTVTAALSDVNDLLANPSSYYVNVHTVEFPAGALRGQLGPATQPTASFVTALAGSGEAPAAGSPDGGGVALVTIGGTTVNYTLIVQGLASTPTAAHIHRGLLGSSGSVVVPFPAPFVNGVSSGTTTITPALAAEILSNPAGFYVNAHTVEFPGGAVRGVLNSANPVTTYIPTVVKAGGLNGTSFVSDLRIVNTTGTTANVFVEFFASAGATTGATGPASTVTVPVLAASQAVYNDVLGGLFGASGLGSLRLTSNVPVVATSRVLNDQRPVGGGTNGLLVPGSVLTDAPINGTLALLSNNSADALAGKVGFRTNIGYFNPTSNTVKATFKALRNDGTVIGTSSSVTIAGFARVQQAVFDLIATTTPGDVSWDDFYVTYTTDGPLFVYSTVIDNKTGDGIYGSGANPR